MTFYNGFFSFFILEMVSRSFSFHSGLVFHTTNLKNCLVNLGFLL